MHPRIGGKILVGHTLSVKNVKTFCFYIILEYQIYGNVKEWYDSKAILWCLMNFFGRAFSFLAYLASNYRFTDKNPTVGL